MSNTTILSKGQNHRADCANICGLLRKAELYYQEAHDSHHNPTTHEIHEHHTPHHAVLPIGEKDKNWEWNKGFKISKGILIFFDVHNMKLCVYDINTGYLILKRQK